MKKYLTKNNIIYISIFIIFVLWTLYEFHSGIKLLNVNKYLKMLLYFIIVLVDGLFSYFIKRAFQKEWKLEKIFLLLIIPMGLIYSTFIPLGRIHDEPQHYLRVLDITKGHLYGFLYNGDQAAGMLPYESADLISISTNYHITLQNLFTKESGVLKPLIYTQEAVYSFIFHLPQAIGVLIGNILSLPILIKGYLGRTTNFICWLFLAYYTLKFLPFKKYAILAIFLLPVMVQQSYSLSIDVLVHGTSLLLISYILYLRYSEDSPKKLETKHILFLTILSLFVSISKMVYFPICLLLFLIPNEKFSSKKKKNLWIIAITVLFFILNVFISYEATIFVVNTIYHTDLKGQLIRVLKNPFVFVIAFINAFRYYWFGYIIGFTTSVGTFDVHIPHLYTGFISLILLIIGLGDYTKLKKRDNIYSLRLIVVITLMIFGVEFLAWTEYNGNVIKGVQGRYFYPLAIPFLMVFNFKKFNINIEKYKPHLLLCVVLFDIVVVGQLFNVYLH